MTSTESLQAVDGGDQLVRSPLSQAPAPVDGTEAGSKPLMGIKKETQAVLTYIKQVSFKLSEFMAPFWISFVTMCTFDWSLLLLLPLVPTFPRTLWFQCSFFVNNSISALYDYRNSSHQDSFVMIICSSCIFRVFCEVDCLWSQLGGVSCLEQF